MIGACSAGLRITVLPATRAALAIPAVIASGKFHGAITATTPSGWYRSSLVSPGRDWVAPPLPICLI